MSPADDSERDADPEPVAKDDEHDPEPAPEAEEPGLRTLVAGGGWRWPRRPDQIYFTGDTANALEQLQAAADRSQDVASQEILDAAEAHYDEPQARADNAERRATAILGGVPVAATVTIAGATVVLDRGKVHDGHWRIALACVLVLLVICLAAACYQALLATTRPFFWSTPNAEDAFQHAAMTPEAVRLHRAADLFTAYARNDVVADVKVRLAGRASLLLAVALALLVVLAVMLGAYGAVNGTDDSAAPTRQPSEARARLPFGAEVRRLMAAHRLTETSLARRSGLDARRLRATLRPGARVPADVRTRVTKSFALPAAYFAETREARVRAAIASDEALRDRVYDELSRAQK